MRVGCRRVRASLSEANSEYRRRTSRSCCLSLACGARISNRNRAYPSSNGIHYVSTPAFYTLSGIRDYDGRIGGLVENLLYTACVAPGFSPRCGLFVSLGNLVVVTMRCRRNLAKRGLIIFATRSRRVRDIVRWIWKQFQDGELNVPRGTRTCSSMPRGCDDREIWPGYNSQW